MSAVSGAEIPLLPYNLAKRFVILAGSENILDQHAFDPCGAVSGLR